MTKHFQSKVIQTFAANVPKVPIPAGLNRTYLMRCSSFRFQIETSKALAWIIALLENHHLDCPASPV